MSDTSLSRRARSPRSEGMGLPPDKSADPDSAAGARIVVMLDQVLRRSGMTLTELSVRSGVTLANLSVLKTGKSRAMRFSTLERVCGTLGCQPGDILIYEKADPGRAADGGPMR